MVIKSYRKECFRHQIDETFQIQDYFNSAAGHQHVLGNGSHTIIHQAENKTLGNGTHALVVEEQNKIVIPHSDNTNKHTNVVNVPHSLHSLNTVAGSILAKRHLLKAQGDDEML